MSDIMLPNGSFTTAERRRRYGRPCKCGCGELTSGSNGKANAPRYTIECWKRIERERAQKRVIKALRRWYREFGYVPGAGEWRFRIPGYDWVPRSGDVQQYFGGWNTAIKAAGLTPRPNGVRRGFKTDKVAA